MLKKRGVTTKKLVTVAFMIAANIVLSRVLSVQGQIFKVSFAYIPVMLAAIILGPIYGGVVGAFGDLLGAILFPVGPYFPGFSLSAFLTGWIYGKFLRKEQTVVRVTMAVVISEIFCSLILNSIWINILYGSPFIALVTTRAVQSGLMIVIEIGTMLVIAKHAQTLKKVYA